MKHNAIYGTILFPDDFTAIVQEIKKREYVEGDTIDACMAMAEHNAGNYGGDWLIPALYNGTINYEVNPC